MKKLADRLGVNHHVSPLRFKLEGLKRDYPLSYARNLEEWMVGLANDRGFKVVQSPLRTAECPSLPEPDQLSNEELAVGMCQTECLDIPQMLRLPAQIISRKSIDIDMLLLVATRERAERVLAELSRQAIKLDPQHEFWRRINDSFADRQGFSSPILHWTRLAEPVMKDGRCHAGKWRLVA